MVTAVTSGSGTTTSAASQDTASLSANYETFLNLLTAQIRNQDPLSPMDTTEWTNQLVQYSSVEQQIKSNSYLEKLASVADANGGMNAAVSYIGKTVSATGDTVTFANGEAAWDYTLGADADAATISIQDSNGTTVWSGAASELSKGTHTLVWDGETSSGGTITGGDYTLKISASNAGGDVATSVNMTGIANAAEVRDGEVMLKVGGSYVALSDITKVY